MDYKLTRIIVYEDDFSTATYRADNSVTGGELLPGFTLEVSSFFERELMLRQLMTPE